MLALIHAIVYTLLCTVITSWSSHVLSSHVFSSHVFSSHVTCYTSVILRNTALRNTERESVIAACIDGVIVVGDGMF